LSAVLRPGATGEAVRDLQRRLGAAGHDCRPESGEYGPATEAALRDFQRSRRLRVDGVCGRQTWSALVESGYALGDRLLYRRRPMLRGDDVADLQQRLNALGFDAGREDGIFGDETSEAVERFQRDAALTSDAICGPATIAALRRVGSFAAGSVASVREREALRHGGRLAGRRLYVCADPGLDALARRVAQGLEDAGADLVLEATGDDESEAALAANRFAADLCLVVRPGSASKPRSFYFASGRFRSEAGYRTADRVLEELTSILGQGEVCGRSYALLRETRMPAVICEPAAAHDVRTMAVLVSRSADVARAIVRGVRRGVEEPLDD